MIHTIGRLLYLKELPSSNLMITPAEKIALRKELLVCCMQVKYIRGVIFSLCYCQAFKLCFNFYSNNVTRGTK